MEETKEGLAAAAATREAARLQATKRQGRAEVTRRAKRRSAAPVPCSHEVAVPEGFDAAKCASLDPALHGTLEEPQWTGPMAKAYPFNLDSFQRMSIACVERKESVLVSAHTSAGKTAVAEYAVALALKNQQRVVYTSPLKALSNQKFRELSEEFGDVGLMTGDVSINPHASCIVMTTEILRSMIYRGSELLREVAWVVFDEVHYMQDRERGVVWEETMIFLPREAKMVFLSATLQNAFEFARWIAYIHEAPCHVVYTEQRPTPLRHYAFPAGGQGLYLVKDELENFREDNFANLQSSFGSRHKQHSSDVKESGMAGARSGGDAVNLDDVKKIVKLIKDRGFEPAIVFSFSRRECEAYAMAASKDLDFNSTDEKQAVADVFESALQCLSVDDRSLPAVQHMLPMLQAGFAVHHSGLLPILKELVEILFQEQLIKCLFSTETFAMGLNMPAKTVVFTAMRKWDGQEHRWMGSGEYIQMSGRAGRRGKDDRGLAFMMVDDQLDMETCRAIVQGKPSPLLSSFKLSYYTLLNLLRRMEGTGADMEYVIRHSFSQFQHESQLPEFETKLKAVLAEAASIEAGTDEAALEFNSLTQERAEKRAIVRKAICQPDHCLHFLRPGRVVKLVEGWSYGVVVTVVREGADGTSGEGTAYTLDVLLCCKPGSAASGHPAAAPLDSQGAEMQIIPAPLSLVDAVSTLRIQIPPDIHAPEPRQAVLLTLQGLVRKYPEGLPELDLVADLGVTDSVAVEAAASVRMLEAKLQANPFQQALHAGGSAAVVHALKRKAALLAEADEIRSRMRKSQLTSFKEESNQRLAVLRKLGHVDSNGIVQLKGKAACEIDTADELLATELMFNGVFNSLDKHQLVALVSCLVPVEKSNEQVKLTAQLAGPLRSLQETARHIAALSLECRLDFDQETYVASFRPSLMDVVYAWSKGSTFAEVCSMTDMFEGSIIRAMRRLDELMQQLQTAAGVVGDAVLAEKFAASRDTIRRGIVFAASLYI